ncbi:MAG: lipid-transfer protein [Desulfuromonadales bacterium]|jgi:acetyl-CoA acetyltransferase|nr:lipid-transfer protein [Gammaproteobacteria bacterium]MDH3959718.1 lipid-transfer protein [Desulfuromonadales bacterium]
MMNKVFVTGVGMIPFVKPGTSDSYNDMGAQAARLALDDAGVDYSKVGQAYVGWVYGDSTAGQAALYDIGLTGIPIINVNNNCSTGSSALYLARQAVESGMTDCALALGFEQMSPGAIGTLFNDRPSPLGKFLDIADARFKDAEKVPMALRLFGGAGYEYQEKYGARTETFAKVRSKASHHAEHNDKAIFRKPVEVEQVMAEDPIFLNLTRLQCCPPTCGAAAAIVCSEAFARANGLDTSVRIAGQALTTDEPSTFSENSLMKAIGYDMAKHAAESVYAQAGIGPQDVDVVELHDCFTTNEVISYEALGLCGEGQAEQWIWDGQNTYGGQVVTNPSGGLLSKGHPLGATGLAQCAELVWQLRGQAGVRQVEGARIGLQHNLGLGGACVVTLYEKQ